jgi:hypothetical protein
VSDIPIEVTVTRSGGFAGIETQAAVDTAHLRPDQAAELRSLVRRADPAALDRRLAGAREDPRGRDRFHYDVDIRVGDEAHQFSVGEAEMPAELKAVVDAVMRYGRPG